MDTCLLCKASGLAIDDFEKLPFPSAFLHTRFHTAQTAANTLVCVGCYEGEIENACNESHQRYLDDLVNGTDDSPATTAPAATQKSAAVKVKTYKIGINRGNGRIWLEGKLIESAGFDCGIEYTRVDNVDSGVITLHVGRVSGIDGLHFPVRRVTDGNKKGIARPVIELSDATILQRFAGFTRVEVEFHNGMLIYRGAK